MTEKQARKIFEKYNPINKVMRCPRGRAPFRTLLDAYAKAAVNLYGVIQVDELVEIINCQNEEQTSKDEVFMLLLPLVHKSKWYCFYKNYIVHYIMFDDFELADDLLEEQSGKPRFIPKKKELLKFADEYHESDTQLLSWRELLDFVIEEFEDRSIIFLCIKLKEAIELGFGPQIILGLLSEYDIDFYDENQMQKFLNLVMEACNNTKIWANKGYAPIELDDACGKEGDFGDSIPKIRHKNKKIGQNESCPCGSGKKYKKCCKKIMDEKAAQLSQSECELFYEIWMGLMDFVNKKKRVIGTDIQPFSDYLTEEQTFQLREVLWENPELIGDYIESCNLTKEKIDILESWRDYHIQGGFILMEYVAEYAIAIGSDKQNEDVLYGIKGISRPLSEILRRELPIQVLTVILPFKDKVIYDSFLSPMEISFGAGAKRAFREMYEKALKKGIVTKLT